MKTRTTLTSVAYCVAGFVLPSALVAAEPVAYDRYYSQMYKDCNGDAETSLDRVACTSNELNLQEGRINQAYIMVMRHLPQPAKDALRANQRQWVAAKDRRCTTGDLPSMGWSRSVAMRTCLIDETIKRRLQLEAM